jgi:hypothetical protein
MPRNLEAVSQFKISTKRSSDRGLWHTAAHHAAFSTGAFCKVQLILRSCLSSQGKAWQALHLRLTFSRLLVRQPRLAHRSTPLQIFRRVQLILRSCGSGVGGVERNGMQHVLRRGRLCTKIVKLLYPFMHSNFRQASYLIKYGV